MSGATAAPSSPGVATGLTRGRISVKKGRAMPDSLAKPDAPLDPPATPTENPYGLSAAALHLCSSRPLHWGLKLLPQLLADEIDRSRPLLSAPPVGTRPRVREADFNDWFHERIDAFKRLVNFTGDSADSTLFHREVKHSEGQPDVGGMVITSRNLGALYRQAIEWMHSVRNAEVHPRWRKVAYELSFFADPLIRALEACPSRMMEETQAAIARSEADGEPSHGRVEVILKIDYDKDFDASRLKQAMAEALANHEDSIPRAEVSPSSRAPGYIYILTNRSLGNLIKIGKTTRSPRERVDELSAGTGIPTPFVLAFDAYVEDCSKAEEYVHSRLERDGYRVASNREFFNVDVATAIEVILEAQRTVCCRGYR
jgi:hypothetical protein